MTPASRRRGVTSALFAALLPLVGLCAGCLVLSLDRFYDDLSISVDERLIGTWRNDDDDVTVTVERSDWRAYRVKYEQTIEAGALTAYLFRAGDRMFVDLTPVRGQDFGSFAVPVHAVLMVTLDSDELRVSPLSYDWFDSGLRQQQLPEGLAPVRAERGQILLSAGPAALEAWLAGLPPDAPAFGPVTIFRRRPSHEASRTQPEPLSTALNSLSPASPCP